jgi:hypothetical protein
MKELANSIYKLLDKHWNCNCPQWKLIGAREAIRLNENGGTVQSLRPFKLDMAPNNRKVVKSKRNRTNDNFAKRIEILIGKCKPLPTHLVAGNACIVGAPQFVFVLLS